MQNSKYLIIGNGIAGLTAAETIRKNDISSTITIISSEKYLTYFRIKLCELIGKDISNIYMHTEKWYAERNISLKLDCRATQILCEKKIVLLENQQEFSYDKLIIASGSHSNIPPILGASLKNVYSIRTLDDIEKINAQITNTNSAIVIGGGLLGLEAAYNLNKSNIHTTLIERNDRILPRQLDYEGSNIFEKKIHSLGIDIIKNNTVSKIDGSDKVESVIVSSNQTLPADIVIIAAGVNPSNDLLKNSEIDCGKFVTVNKYMATNINDVFAAGDVAAYNNRNFSLWTVSMEQGKIAGHNVSSDKQSYKEYVQKLPPYFLRSMNTKLYSLGDIGNDKTIKYDTLVYKNKENHIYHKLFFNNDIIVGAIIIGQTENALKISNGIKNKICKNKIRNLDTIKY